MDFFAATIMGLYGFFCIFLVFLCDTLGMAWKQLCEKAWSSYVFLVSGLLLNHLDGCSVVVCARS